MHYTDDLENKYVATFLNQSDCLIYALFQLGMKTHITIIYQLVGS